MQCLSITRYFKRCKNKGKIFCYLHWYQYFMYPFYFISCLVVIASFYIYYIKPIVDNFSINNSLNTDSEPFQKSKNSYNVLILPFELREDCTFKNTYLEQTIRDRLINLSEKDKINLNVRFDTTQACPLTFSEGKEIGHNYNADLVLWGDFYEQCYTDTVKACLKYVVLREANLNIENVGETGIQKIASMADITEGYLQKDIDYAIFWTLGLKAFQEKKYDDAIKIFEKIKSRFSGNFIELYYYLGFSYCRLRKHKKCEEEYSLALKIDLKNPNVNNAYAVLLKNINNDYKKARKHYEIALVGEPDNASILCNYATLLQTHFNEYEIARQYYEKSIKINSDYYLALHNYAFLLTNHLSNHVKAKEYFLRAIKSDSTFSLAYFNLGVLLENHLKDYSAAKFNYEKAIKYKTNDADYYFVYALLLQNHFDDFQSAKLNFMKALELKSYSSDIHSLYAVLLADYIHDYNLAIKHFKISISLDPKRPDNYANLAIILHHNLHQYNEAKRYYIQALELDSLHAGVHFNYSALLSKYFGDKVQAKKHYLKAVAIDSSFKNKEAEHVFNLY